MSASRSILIRVLGAVIALAGIIVLIEERSYSGSYLALIAIGCGVAFAPTFIAWFRKKDDDTTA